MAKVYVLYAVKEGYGYVFQIWRGAKKLDEYFGGDSWKDSQTFGTGEVKFNDLLRFARGAAEETLKEMKLWKPKIEMTYDEDLEAYLEASLDGRKT